MTGLFREPRVKANRVCRTINSRGSFNFFYVCVDIVQKLRILSVFLRGINAGNPERAIWAHLARLCNQPEHRIRFILPGRVASYIIKWLIEQDIYRPIIYYPISRSQVSACCFFPRKSQIESLSYNIQHMMVSWWSNEVIIFFKPVKTGSSVPKPKYWENIYSTVDIKFLFHFLSSSLLLTVGGENE